MRVKPPLPELNQVYDSQRHLVAAICPWLWGPSAEGTLVHDVSYNHKHAKFTTGSKNKPTYEIVNGEIGVSITDVWDDLVQFVDNTNWFPNKEITIVHRYKKPWTTVYGPILFGVGPWPEGGDPIHCYETSATGIDWRFSNQTLSATVRQLGEETTTMVFTAGPRGLDVWQDGELVASSATVPAVRTSAESNVVWYQPMGTQGDVTRAGTLFLHEIYDKQLDKQWIAEKSLDPYRDYQPVEDAVASVVTAGPVVQSDITLPLIQASTDITLSTPPGTVNVSAAVTLPLIQASTDITLSTPPGTVNVSAAVTLPLIQAFSSMEVRVPVDTTSDILLPLIQASTDITLSAPPGTVNVSATVTIPVIQAILSADLKKLLQTSADITLPLIQAGANLGYTRQIQAGANVTLPLIQSSTSITIVLTGAGTMILDKGAIHDRMIWPRNSVGSANDIWLDGSYLAANAVRGEWRLLRYSDGVPMTGWSDREFSLFPSERKFYLRDVDVATTNEWKSWELRLFNKDGTVIENYNPDIGSGRFRWAVGVNVLAIGQSNMEAFMTGRLNLSPNPTDPIGQCGPAWTEPLGDGAIQFGNELHAALNVPIGMLTSATGATSLTPKADIAAGAIGWWMDFKEPKGPGNGYLFQKTNALFDIPTTLWNDTNSYIPPRVEGMLIYQGEAEAIAVSVTDFTNNSLNGPGEYRGLLRQVLEFYRERCASWNGKPPVAVMELSANRSVSYDNAQSQAIGYQPGMAYDAVRDAVLQMGAMHDWVYPVFTADGALDDHIHMDETAFVIYATRCANALRHYHAGGGNGWEPVITDTTVGTVGPYLSYAYQQDLQTIRVKTIIDTTTTMIVPAGASNTFVVYRSDVTGQNMIPVDGVFWDEPNREIVLNLEVPLRTPLFELEYAGHADLDPLDLIKDGNGYPLQHTFGASEKKGELKNVDTQNGRQYHQAAPIVGSRYLPGSLAGPHTTHGIAGNVTGGTDSSPIILALSLSVIAGMKFTVFRWTGPNASEYVGTGIIRERLGDTLTLSKAITGLVIGDTMTFDVASSFIAGLTPAYIPTNHHESGQSMIGIGIRSHTSAPTATTMNIKRGD